jgi:hypothetical protein
MASAHSLAKLIKFIHRTEWEQALVEVVEQHLGEACSKFEIGPEELIDVVGELTVTVLQACALEDFMARDYEDGHNVVDEYLRRRGFAESPGNRRYMQALRRSVMSLYEVSDIVPGQSFLARDLIRGGEPVRVMEVSGTRMLKPWDRVGARLIREGSEWRMGGGLLRYERRASDFLVDTLKRIDGGLPADLREFAELKSGPESVAAFERNLAEKAPLAIMAPTFTGIWLSDTLQRTLDPQLPELVNTDGDPLIICTTSFPLLPGMSAAACRDALASVADLREIDAKAFNWVRRTAVEPQPLTTPQSGNAVEATTGSGETSLGSIEVKAGEVVLSTNSRERAEHGEAMVARALAGLADTPARQEVSAAQILAERMGHGSGRPPASAMPPEEARGMVHAHLDQHYRKTLDEPLPVLGNISPRDAARCDNGRSKLVDWLKEIENHAARAGNGSDPMASYDFGWIWRELGIGHMRM